MNKIQFPKFTEKMKRRFLAGASGVLMIFISIMAYFTSTEQVTNRFTVGEVKIDLVEPNWVGDADTSLENNNRKVDNKDVSYSDANYILPGELVPKDPKIVNTGKNEAIVFMKVEMPVYTDVLGEEHEVFVVSSRNGEYNADVTPYYEFSKLQPGDFLDGAASNWCYLGKVGETGQDKHTYIFGYKIVLNPEEQSKKIKDGVNEITAQDHEPLDYETDNLFKYVMLNPELNSIDAGQGETFYNSDGTPVLQNIKIYAYGVQSQFLSNNGTAITPADTGFTSDQLTSIWETAKFGEIANNTIPEADNHNKYDIPADPRNKNYPTEGNAWTNGEGTPIISGDKGVLTRKITYANDGNDASFEVIYKKIQGDSSWIGWYPSVDANTTWKIGNTVFSTLQELQNYINNSTGDLTINLESGTFPDSTSLSNEDKNPSVTTVTVTFKESGNANAATVGTAEFTKIGDADYVITRGAAELPSAGDENVWCTEAAYDATKVISNYDDLVQGLNGTDITLYKVSTT